MSAKWITATLVFEVNDPEGVRQKIGVGIVCRSEELAERTKKERKGLEDCGHEVLKAEVYLPQDSLNE